MATDGSLIDQEILKRGREHLSKLRTHLKDGVRFSGIWVDDFDEMFKQLSCAQLGSNDVIICGYPRSGNHWSLEYVSMILSQVGTCGDIEMGPHFLDMMGSKVHERLEAMAEPRLLISHFQPQFLPKDILQKPIKIVYLLRNPKDILVSWYKLVTNAKHDRFVGTWEEYLELHFANEFIWGSWIDHVIKWDKFMKEHPQVEVFVAQYEKLKEEPVQVMKDLCKFLGKPDTLAAEIANATEFENMKSATVAKQKAHDELIVQSGNSVAMVSGKVRNWKSSFTVDQNDRYNKIFEESLVGNPFADLVRQYIY